MEIDIQSFDIPRKVSIYPDKDGIRWWTKAWFNNRKIGEAAVLISRMLAIKFINDEIEKNEWLQEFYPQQMEIYYSAIEQTKQALLKSQV